jgi:phosphopantothenoylcysteine decarboxylase / phosphopantothenate---cysteine ligase
MILLGVTASIAAYKAVEILRLLVKAGKDVQVMMTPAATHFVGPLTFQALSGHPVLSDVLDANGWQMAHLAMAERSDAVVVAPASAESLSTLGRGGANDFISASVLAIPRHASGKLKTPVYLAPAMHEAMWLHPATQHNVSVLKSFGYQFIGPVQGPLGRAKDAGHGRMAEPGLIVSKILNSHARTKKL